MERGKDSVLGRDQGQEVQGLWMRLEEAMPVMVLRDTTQMQCHSLPMVTP